MQPISKERARLLGLNFITEQQANTPARVSSSPDRTDIWVVDAHNATDALDHAKAFYKEANPGNYFDSSCTAAHAEKDGDGFGCGETMYIFSQADAVAVEAEPWTEWASRTFVH